MGRRLLRPLIEVLRGVEPSERRVHGVREVLAYRSANEGRDAGRFYEREGFEEVRRLRRIGWKMGRWIDTRIFQMSLGEREGEKMVE